MKMPWGYAGVLSGPLSSLSPAALVIPPVSHNMALLKGHLETCPRHACVCTGRRGLGQTALLVNGEGRKH